MNRIIPLFKSHWTTDDILAVEKVIKRGTQWAVGPEIEEFEKKLAEFHGVGYALTFNSGTSALVAMYKAIGIEDKEVIVPSFTFIATANAVIIAGGIPVFAESEEETFGLDAQDVEKKITSKTKAIVALHYAGGVSRDIEKLQASAQRHNLILLEDNAHSLGVKKNGKLCGTFGTAAALSFCQNKLITTGEGGAVITDSKDIYEKMKLLRSHGRVDNIEDYFSSTGESDYVDVGYNLRMPTMNAALGLSQLQNFNKIITQRVKIGTHLNQELNKIKGIVVPFPYSDSDHFYQMYTIMLNDKGTRDALHKHLIKKGIMCKVYYSPIHLTTFYQKKYGYKENDFPATEKITSRVLTLPIYPGLSFDEIDFIVETIREFFSENENSRRDILAIIPARGGSKGIPKKNIKNVGGKPLIAYSIEQALASDKITKVVVSTDNDEIAEVARNYGAEVIIRPLELAEDNTPMLPVLKHAVETTKKEGFNPDIVILLQPTNPLRKASLIDKAVQLLIDNNYESITAVHKLDLNPSCIIKIDSLGKASPYVQTNFYSRRQDINPLYVINGLLYVYKTDALLQLETGSWCNHNGALIVDKKYSLDIDTEEDLKKAEQILKTVRE